jgi:RimJ/RimL family protein N-acetyltransferase
LFSLQNPRELRLDYLRFNEREDGEAIAKAARISYNPSSDVVIARVVQDELAGGALLQAWTGASASIHMAGFWDRWANRDLLWCTFDYCFLQLGLKCLIAQVPSDNEVALKIDKRMGFREVARIPDVFHTGDCVILQMYKEDCRWLSVRPRHTLRGE